MIANLPKAVDADQLLLIYLKLTKKKRGLVSNLGNKNFELEDRASILEHKI